MKPSPSVMSLARLAGRPLASNTPLGLFACALLVALTLPLPSLVLDLLVALNLTVGFALLILALSATSIVELSSFPSLLLLTTMARIAVSVATARAILAHGDAGRLIQSFGEFMVSGNVVVGLVVFLIIGICQFLVITKGAERIAEVAARFTLDAMPGQQMSIEADLRADTITKDEAVRRRKLLRQESQLVGALDGAMKFVKGDSIATFFIVMVNLIGGLTIAVFDRGMSVGQAMQSLSVLSIGDGLVAQLPSLMSALAAGVLVTGVGSDSGSTASRITSEVQANRAGLAVAAVIILVFASVAEVPWWALVLLASPLAFVAVRSGWKTWREAPADASADPSSPRRPLPKRRLHDAFVASVHPATLEALEKANAPEHLEKAARALIRELGIGIPILTFEKDTALSEGVIVLRVENLVRERFDFDAATDVRLLARQINDRIVREFPKVLSGEDVDRWFNEAQKSFSNLVASARFADIDTLVEVFRQLTCERVPLSHPRALLERISSVFKQHGSEAGPELYIESVREALRAQVVDGLRARFGGLAAHMLDDGDVLMALRSVETGGGHASLQSIETCLHRLLTVMTDLEPATALVVPDDLRLTVARLARDHDVDVPILSQSDWRHTKSEARTNEVQQCRR